MINTVYRDFIQVNKLQTDIMIFVGYWVREIKTPVPQKEIILKMKSMGIKDFTTVWALNALMKKGFIRRAYTEKGNTTEYVQLRSV